MTSTTASGAVRVGPGIATAHLAPLVVVLWRDSGGGQERVDWMRTSIKDATQMYPGGFVLLSAILPTSEPPDQHARAQLQDAFRQANERLLLGVHFLMGDSLRVSLGRTFLRGMFLMGAQGDRHRVAGSVTETCELILKNTSKRIDRAALVELLTRMCAELHVLPAPTLE